MEGLFYDREFSSCGAGIVVSVG